jgi:hypothetical protein
MSTSEHIDPVDAGAEAEIPEGALDLVAGGTMLGRDLSTINMTFGTDGLTS